MKIISGIITVLVIIGLVCLLPKGCTKPDNAIRVLTSQGYTQIEITGWRPFMASEDDIFSTGFHAKSPSGADVTGAVTSGTLKGSTIRLD